MVQCKLAKSLLRRFPRNQFLLAQYVGTSWRSLPQRFVAISFVGIASSKRSSFRRNALLAGPCEQATTIVFTFLILLAKVGWLCQKGLWYHKSVQCIIRIRSSLGVNNRTMFRPCMYYTTASPGAHWLIATNFLMREVNDLCHNLTIVLMPSTASDFIVLLYVLGSWP